MADEKLNLGPDEVNAAEPEVAEQAIGDSPPEAAARHGRSLCRGAPR